MVHPPFINRRAELSALGRTLGAALSGQPSVVLTAGEAGVGKTRLLREFRGWATGRGFTCWYGQCYEDVRLPYRPLVEALLPQVEKLAPQGAPHAEPIRQFLLQGQAAGLGSTTGDGADRHRLFLALSQAVIAQTRSEPTIWITDDLHWADAPSLDLFEHMVFAMAQAAPREPVPLVLIASYRSRELDARLQRALARFRREEICQDLELSGLDQSDTTELIAGLGVKRPSQQLVSTVRAATSGNPLFVQEVLAHLEKRGALREREGFIVSALDASDVTLPPDLTSAIAGRTRDTSDRCQQILTFASFLGDRFALEDLALIVGSSESELLDPIDEAVEQRVLQSEDREFRFAHPLIRHVFYNEPSTARRQRIHAEIAARLEARITGDADPRVLQIAHHLVRAGPAAPPEKLLHYARRAGDQASGVFAWGEAAHFYEAALVVAGADEASDRLRAELHQLAGYAYDRNWDIGPCRDHYSKAIEGWRELGDLVGAARTLMRKVRSAYTTGTAAYGALPPVDDLERDLQELGEDEPALRAQILETLAGAYWTARQRDKAEDHAARALRIAEQLDDDNLCSVVRGVMGMSHLQTLHVQEALESWERSLEHARRAGNAYAAAQAQQRIPMTLYWLGRLDDAEATALEAREQGELIQDWAGGSLALGVLACLALLRGDFEATEQHAHEAMKLLRRSRYLWGGPTIVPALACARAMRGALAEARDAIDVLVKPDGLFESPEPLRATAEQYRTLLRAYADASPELRAEVEAQPRRPRRRAEFDIGSLAGLCAQVELADLLDSPKLAEPMLEPLSLARERGVVFASGWISLVPRVLGVATALVGRWAEAERHFESAVDVAESSRAKPELARSCLDFARMLSRRAQAEDESRARELVARAGSLFAELGMEPFHARALVLAQDLGVALDPFPTPVQTRGERGGERLSAQEARVLEQIARGRTNAQIADELVLSPKAVSQQAGDVFRKIGVEGRTPATAYAIGRQIETGRAAVEDVITHYAVGGVRESPLIILLTDLVGSTELLERLGDLAGRELLQAHNRIIRECLSEHFGAEVQSTGDGFIMYFFSADAALACAMAIQTQFAEHNRAHPKVPLSVRVGVHAGDPVPDEGRLVGVAVNAAARICSHAKGRQILISDDARRLLAETRMPLEDRGPVLLKGLSRPLRLYDVGWRGGSVH